MIYEPKIHRACGPGDGIFEATTSQCLVVGTRVHGKHRTLTVTNNPALVTCRSCLGQWQERKKTRKVVRCYGGCGLRYQDFGLDVILPTALWNRIAVGKPFDETQTDIERDGRGGVLCANCIVKRLAKLPGVTVAFLTTER
jgi:hypothetical protein